MLLSPAARVCVGVAHCQAPAKAYGNSRFDPVLRPSPLGEADRDASECRSFSCIRTAKWSNPACEHSRVN